MSGGRRSCNGVLNSGDLIRDGLITYRRKKRARVAGIENPVKGSFNGAHDEHDVSSGVGSHCRSTMVHMVRLPGLVGEGSRIQSCVHDSLRSCIFSKTEMAGAALTQAEDRYEVDCEIQDPLEVKVVFPKSAADGSNVKLENQTDINQNTAKFQKILLEIFCSENFASLCGLICESFQNKIVSKLLDFSLINSKLRNGVYEHMPLSFDEDIQQLWSKLQNVGQDILLLSSSLSKLSSISYGKEVGEKLGLETCEEQIEDNPQGTAEFKNSTDSYITGQFPLSDSDRSNKVDQSEASCLCKVHACKQCGIETAGERRLICDGCEAVYHFTCVDPFSQDLPSRSWYCSSCRKDSCKSPESNALHKWAICERSEFFAATKSMATNCECNCSSKPYQREASCRYKVYTCKHCRTEAIGEHSLICDGCEAIYHISCVEPSFEGTLPRNWYCSSCSNGRTEVPEPVIEGEPDGVHQNCSVCDRLELSKDEKDTRESSVSSLESGEPPEPSRTAMAHLCKLCGTCEDEDRRFLTCANNYCFYKYYHIRCLRNSQVASQHQRNRHWYCPSCLCRACYVDQDDADIVLCDGCDDAYHTYCMKPPRTSVPKGQWFCIQCNIARAKEGMRRHEQWILQQHCKKDVFQATEKNRQLDILLNAVDKVSCSADRRE